MEQTGLRHPSGREKITVSFDRFLPFVHLDSVDQPLRERFLSFLEELHRGTGEVWKPSSCYAAEWMNEEIKRLRFKGLLDRGIVVQPVELKPGAHFWFVAVIEGCDEELVIDPWGVPTPGHNFLDEPETVIPFFGEAKFAPPHAGEVYGQGTKVINDYFHVFHP